MKTSLGKSWPGKGDNPSSLNPFRRTGIHIPTKWGAGHDGQTASFLLFKVGGAPWPERDVISPRRGRDALDAISGRPAGGGRWVWGGSGAGDGGVLGGGGSGTSGRSPGSSVKWAGECLLEWWPRGWPAAERAWVRSSGGKAP